MKILLFGGNGYIGNEFVRQIKNNKSLVLSCASSRNETGKYLNLDELNKLVNDISPSVIINSSAYVGGDSIVNCEKDKFTTFNANVQFPILLRSICLDKNILLGHLSSGCLYTGYVKGGYKESDDRNICFETSCSYYTGTKGLAEDVLNDGLDNKYIWRIRLPFDEVNNIRNYLSKMLGYDKLINFQNSISNRKELVKACLECVIKEIPFGTYHITNPGSISAKEITDIAKKILNTKKEFKFFDNMEEFNILRKIPTSNVILNTDKLKNVGIKMNEVHDSVEQSFRNWKI